MPFCNCRPLIRARGTTDARPSSFTGFPVVASVENPTRSILCACQQITTRWDLEDVEPCRLHRVHTVSLLSDQNECTARCSSKAGHRLMQFFMCDTESSPPKAVGTGEKNCLSPSVYPNRHYNQCGLLQKPCSQTGTYARSEQFPSHRYVSVVGTYTCTAIRPPHT